MPGLILLVALVPVLADASWREQLYGNSGRIETNQVVMHSPPKWLNARRVQRVTDKIQGFLEWDIRKVNVYWYDDQKAFEKAHGLGPTVRAAAKPQDGSIHLGPKVDDKSFDAAFGHELAHVIVFQKYKTAIPKWLDEGLANYVSRAAKADYAYVASRPARPVTSMSHPFRGGEDPYYVYQASTALMEWIAERCQVKDLLQLSVGKKLEGYLKTYCEIRDLDADFHGWIRKKAGGKTK